MYEYKIKEYSGDVAAETDMNRMARTGWRVIAVNPLTCFDILDSERYAVTYERRITSAHV